MKLGDLIIPYDDWKKLRDENAQLREALREIGRQMLLSEMGAEQAEYADLETGYEKCVKRARAVLLPRLSPPAD